MNYRGAILEAISLLNERLVLVHKEFGLLMTSQQKLKPFSSFVYLLHVGVSQHLLLCELCDCFLRGIERLLELCYRFHVWFLSRGGLFQESKQRGGVVEGKRGGRLATA